MLDEDRLKAVIGVVLKIPADSVGEETSTDTVSGWDSLRHLNLILALEEAFAITIPDDEVGNLTSYPLIRIVVAGLAPSHWP